MVQVLENKFVDLNVMPGETLVAAQRQVRQQIAAGVDGAQVAFRALTGQGQGQGQGEGAQGSAQEGEQVEGQVPETDVQKISEEEYNNMSSEEKEKAKSTGAVIVDGTGKVLYALGSTVGGVVKGVGDTMGNVVYDVGTGVGKVGTGLVGGLYDTAKAPLAAGSSDDTKSVTAAKPAVQSARQHGETGHIPVNLENKEDDEDEEEAKS